MAELPAINTSPLIFLTKGGFLDLLLLMGSSIIVPSSVAKQRGVIPAARPVLEQLRQCGMYLSDPVINLALALVGE